MPDVTIPAEMLKLAEHILDTKAADFDPSKFENHYEVALVNMLEKKQAGANEGSLPGANRLTN